mgnify:CR=1 FL=1
MKISNVKINTYKITRFFLFPLIIIADYLQTKCTKNFTPMNMGPVADPIWRKTILKHLKILLIMLYPKVLLDRWQQTTYYQLLFLLYFYARPSKGHASHMTILEQHNLINRYFMKISGKFDLSHKISLC